MRLREAEAKLEQVRGDKPTIVIVNPKEGGADFYADDRANVRFQLGEDWVDHIDVRIEQGRNGDRVLLVHGGLTGIEITPQSGNVVTVRLRK